MQGIKKLTTDLIERTCAFEENDETLPLTEFICPTDNLPMRESFRTYKSQDGLIKINKYMGNRAFQAHEIATLLNERKLGPIDGFCSKAGKPFSAMIVIDEQNKTKFEFGSNEADDEDISEFPVMCQCPCL